MKQEMSKMNGDGKEKEIIVQGRTQMDGRFNEGSMTQIKGEMNSASSLGETRNALLGL